MTSDPTDGYLSRNREHLARQQRQRRARMVRIDYMPSGEALAIIDAKRAQLRPGSVPATNSAVLDAILTEWAKFTGIKCGEMRNAMTSARSPEFSERSARAYDFGNRRLRVPCGARRHRDGQPCCALSEPGKRRCRFHGGRSTGPRTEAGKTRALANLRRNGPQGTGRRDFCSP